MIMISLDKRPYSIDKIVWNIYKRYCNAVERGEEERASRAKRTLYAYGYSLLEDCHGRTIPVKNKE